MKKIYISKDADVRLTDYLTAQDDLAAQEDAVRTAEHDLFTAYNTYDWAKRGYIGSAA